MSEPASSSAHALDDSIVTGSPVLGCAVADFEGRSDTLRAWRMRSLVMALKRNPEVGVALDCVVVPMLECGVIACANEVPDGSSSFVTLASSLMAFTSVDKLAARHAPPRRGTAIEL